MAAMVARENSFGLKVALMEKRASYARDVSRLRRTMGRNQSKSPKTASGTSGIGVPMSQSIKTEDLLQTKDDSFSRM